MAEPEGTLRPSCPEESLLVRFVEDELPPEEDTLVARHVQSCPLCQQILDRIQRRLPPGLEVLRRLPRADRAEPPPLSSDHDVIGPLGEGGMGVVWRVLDREFGRELAVKVMKTGRAGTPELERRFLDEAQISGRLMHPGIVPVHALGRLEDGRPYYSMKLVAGRTLASLLKDRSQPADQSMEWLGVFLQVCQAVGYAHSQGVIHRDLKPDNVMVGEHGEVQVLDWGLAKELRKEEAGRRKEEAGRLSDSSFLLPPSSFEATQEGMILGTPAYMAPEQARGAVVDRRSDVFGLGAILCEILTGGPPYRGSDPTVLILRAARADLEDAWERLQGCGADPELIRLAIGALSPTPDDRPADGRVLATSVKDYLSGVEKRLQQERLERERERVRAAEERRRRKLWVGLAASVLAALGIALAFIVFQKQAATDLQASLRETRRSAAHLAWGQARQSCEGGEVGHGLLLFARALEMAPRGPVDANFREALRIELAGWHRLSPTLFQVWQHPDKVHALAVCPQGETVVTGCEDGRVRLWDLRSGRLLRELPAHRGAVRAVGFCGAGDTFLTGGDEGELFLWRTRTAEQIGRLDGHTGAVHAVAISRDGTRALTGGADATSRLWDLRNRTCLKSSPYDGPVRTVAFSPVDEKYLTGGEIEFEKGEAWLHELRKGQPDNKSQLRRKPGKDLPGAILSAAFSPDGKTLVLGDANWEFHLWDMNSRKLFALSNQCNGNVRAVAVAPDGKTVLTGADHSAMLHLWDAAASREQWENQGRREIVRIPRSQQPPILHPAPVTAVAFGPDTTSLLTACEDGFVRVWKQAPGPQATSLKHSFGEIFGREPDEDRDNHSVAFDPLGRFVAAAGWDDKVRLWKVPGGEFEDELVHKEAMIVAFTPDGKFVVTGCAKGHVRFWNLATRQEYEQPLFHMNLKWLRLDPKGKSILTASSDGTAQLWSVEGRSRIGQPLRHSTGKPLASTAISPGQKMFLTGGEDTWARVWNQDGVLLHELPHQGAVWDVKFTRDGREAVTASHDGKVRFFDLTTGKPERKLIHRSSVNGFSLTPDGKRILTGGRGEHAQLWDIQLERRLGPGCPLTSEIQDVAVGPDGTTAVLADWNGHVALWSLPMPVPEDLERIKLWVQTTIGMTLDESGAPQPLSGSNWLSLRRQLEQLGGPF